MTGTHTYVELELSRGAYEEIREALSAHGYQHAFHGEAIDMHGIALTLKKPPVKLGTHGYRIGGELAATIEHRDAKPGEYYAHVANSNRFRCAEDDVPMVFVVELTERGQMFWNAESNLYSIGPKPVKAEDGVIDPKYLKGIEMHHVAPSDESRLADYAKQAAEQQAAALVADEEKNIEPANG